MAKICFENERDILEDDLKQSLLDISLKHAIPHMHVCGGKARCSTCRVLVCEGAENLLPMNVAEQTLAEKKGLESNIRLACQARVKGDVSVRRLVLDDEDAETAMFERQATTGREQNVAILFSDIRGFTQFSERHLSYDIIHILNRYFQEMGEVVLANHGYIDKYMGDGLMALFGVDEQDNSAICMQAVTAALQMDEALKRVNGYLKQNFNEQFEIGVGVHIGEVVLGNIGHRDKAHFTAIGDAVNMASRVESETKMIDSSILVSQCIYAHIHAQVEIGQTVNTQLKGKSGDYLLYEVLGLKQG
ncbi:adenylate/guanylate cyclase domain-containing protein [Mariprofundus sp. EBB-1]|uniref:adenylate/guanylate cyclase domain-containing protein n=1 Tax=Mariprofundus sp. EBB-1 TaxID=2650971 RepID=UPI000EF18303|nr:adenylate/guanylate cyclase domain-containing protein [Mariprofundus sp. EBB-1]RLL53288.1 adenylate/guanylate cyclase domain-containing protein [Mariprofundus sp. EBB-1]